MPQHENQDPYLFAAARREAAGLTADLQKLATARWQLVRLEAAGAAGSVRRLSVALLAAVALALIALAVLTVGAADALDGRLGVPRWGWLCSIGSGLLLLAALTGWAAWRRFQLEFAGFDATLAELREDMAWLRDRFGRE